ncbi:C-type lectin domain-containing protein, partial [Salmonella sp. s54836]|uniref:C-type lectin domain-containing protein n=1 Tax=Salmonella sp. s54836 TaxID=3159673 RepID=UPI0039818D6A
MYVTTLMNWDNAEVNCIQLGGHLASIHSAAENTALNNLRTNTEYPWIGYNDRTTEGTYMWSDGSTVDYINWHSGEP